MEIYFEYPYYLIIVAAFFAAAFSFILYYKDKAYKDLQKRKKWFMAILRALFVFLILLLLLSPIIKTKSIIIQKPIIVVAQDNSQSIVLNKDSIFYQNKFKSDLNNLINSLESEYNLKYLNFSETIENDSITNYTGKMTDISSIFPEIVSKYAGMNLGAIILATDGIYNKGINPVYSNNLNFPIYPIALGDTISQKDLIIKDLIHNKVAFLGNKFPVRIAIRAEKCTEHTTELIISHEGKRIFAKNITFPDNENTFSVDIELPANKLGIQQYTAKLKDLENEISYENNESDFIINIIDNRNKILILANAPHPDIGAITYALKDNPDFELHTNFINDFTGSVASYDLIVLHQLPSLQHSINSVITESNKNPIPTLFILGNANDLKKLNNLDRGLQIETLSVNTDDAEPQFNPDFMSFSLGFDETVFFENMTALKVHYGNYRTLADTKVLLYQSINGIKTDKPLVLFSEQDGVKTGFIAGEGLWKWRIDDYKYNTSHDSFKSLINRIFQYMIVKKMQDKLIVQSDQVFSENQNIIFTAEFYNETYELVPGLDIEMHITDDKNNEYKYTFSNKGDAYRLDLGRIPAGSYSYSVTCSFDEKSYSDQGKIIVKSINVEALNTTANHNILEQLAEQTGGKVFYPDNMDKIKDEISNNSKISNLAFEKEKLLTLTDLFYIFFVILAFATTEWVLRKYWGGY